MSKTKTQKEKEQESTRLLIKMIEVMHLEAVRIAEDFEDAAPASISPKLVLSAISALASQQAALMTAVNAILTAVAED